MYVLSFASDVSTGVSGVVDSYPRVVEPCRVLLAYYATGTAWDRRTRKDSGALARAQFALRKRTRGDLLDDLELVWRLARKIVRPDGVAVHGRVVPRGQIEWTLDVGGDYQTDSVGQGNAFNRKWCDGREDFFGSRMRRFHDYDSMTMAFDQAMLEMVTSQAVSENRKTGKGNSPTRSSVTIANQSLAFGRDGS